MPMKQSFGKFIFSKNPGYSIQSNVSPSQYFVFSSFLHFAVLIIKFKYTSIVEFFSEEKWTKYCE